MAIGMVASVLLHVLVSVLLRTAGSGGPALPEPEPMTLVEFDIHEAPAPPEAELAAEDMAAAEEPEAAQAEEPAPVEEEASLEEEAAAEAAVHPEGIALADAGVADATAVAEAEAADAGVADAAAVAEAEVADAGPGDDAVAVAEAEVPEAADAGPGDTVAGATSGAPPATDAPPGATIGEPGVPGVPGGGSGTSSSGSGASGLPSRAAVAAGTSLLDYLPPDDVVAVFLRFDRLRGTPWAAQAEAILAPMPDYRTLVGSRDAVVADLFDSLIISTPRPRDVTATTLAGRTPLAGDAVRAFLDRPDARVTWSTTRGGPAGRRQPSRLMPARDARVFLMPFPGWIVLTQPGHLGNLLAPGEGELDRAMAPAADLPPWLARLRDIEATMGRDTGPVLAATVEGLLPPVYTVPYVGAITTPRRLTLTVDITKGGFFVRGTMLFDSAESADLFVTKTRKAQGDLTSSRIGRMLLTPIHAYHALRGLSFELDGARVAYATSISVADAQGMLAMTAHWARDFFADPASVRPEPTPSPAPAPGP